MSFVDFLLSFTFYFIPLNNFELSSFISFYRLFVCAPPSLFSFVSSIAKFFLNAEMCADIEIITSNQYDGTLATDAQFPRAIARLRSTFIAGSHVRIDGATTATIGGWSAARSDDDWWRRFAISSDMFLDGPTWSSRIAAHGVWGTAH